MTLPVGTRLGPYEILAPIGAGGMGEVYRARDTRLERTVAVKVLPEHRSSGPEVRQRFEREAKTISQLSHPHICALYDVGREGETEYLVMELLEGETLSDRLAKGPLPLDQTLRFGIEIADALYKAHRQGIVHRDLKPGNVMITSSGVKLLDFGLAKIFTATPASAPLLTSLPTAAPNVTQDGAILGTVPYMSPEQLEGKEADARTDIFALGCVLFEMSTGKRAFSGSSQASLISSIMKEEPAPISSLSPTSPAMLDRVVKTCLAKDREERWQTARDVALQLQWMRDQDFAEGPPASTAARRRSAIGPWILAAASLLTAVVALTWQSRHKAPLRVTRSFLVPPPKTTFHVVGANIAGVAISPDGRRVAFGAREADGVTGLWVRELDALESYRVPGGEGALFPFWSPDSRSIGFFAKGKLKIVEASPSPPPARDLADVTEARGGSWAEDGTILYSPDNLFPLMRVAAAGGKPVAATRLDRAAGEGSHRWPYFLPGGRRFLYEIRKPSSDPSIAQAGIAGIYVGSVDGREKRRILSEDTTVAYDPAGYLFFRRANNLMAVAFDAPSGTIRGEPVVIAGNIEGNAATGASVFSVSENLMAYSPRAAFITTRMVWLDRSGKELSPVGAPGRLLYVALSPDGRAAVAAMTQESERPALWLLDTRVGRAIRLTRSATAELSPVFSADGQRIFFSAYSKGPWDLWETTPQGGKAKPFLELPTTKTANDVSPDGRYLLYREFNPGTRGDLKFVPLTGDPTPRTFIATADEESNGDFSPDGRWVAYTSDESGRREIYAASFPDPSRRLRVSTEGGSQPRWSRDGKELYYVRSGQLMAVGVSREGNDLSFGASQPLFSLPLFQFSDPGFDQVTRYDVAPDGRFLALLRTGEEVPTPLVLVQNWRETLPK